MARTDPPSFVEGVGGTPLVGYSVTGQARDMSPGAWTAAQMAPTASEATGLRWARARQTAMSGFHPPASTRGGDHDTRHRAESPGGAPLGGGGTPSVTTSRLGANFGMKTPSTRRVGNEETPQVGGGLAPHEPVESHGGRRSTPGGFPSGMGVELPMGEAGLESRLREEVNAVLRDALPPMLFPLTCIAVNTVMERNPNVDSALPSSTMGNTPVQEAPPFQGTPSATFRATYATPRDRTPVSTTPRSSTGSGLPPFSSYAATLSNSPGRPGDEIHYRESRVLPRRHLVGCSHLGLCRRRYG